jgi:hypothetical protein
MFSETYGENKALSSMAYHTVPLCLTVISELIAKRAPATANEQVGDKARMCDPA